MCFIVYGARVSCPSLSSFNLLHQVLWPPKTQKMCQPCRKWNGHKLLCDIFMAQVKWFSFERTSSLKTQCLQRLSFLSFFSLKNRTLFCSQTRQTGSFWVSSPKWILMKAISNHFLFKDIPFLFIYLFFTIITYLKDKIIKYS